MAVVTFTTDFGSSDAYVGAMKGVILSLAPGTTLVDICHDIPPQDVRAAAMVLADAAPCFPAGCIHLAVIDPGVGSARSGIVVEARGQLFVGPDNGVLSVAAPPPRRIHCIASQLCRRPQVSPTFHGRDIFAVTAARLAAGHVLAEVGPTLDHLIEVTLPTLAPLTDDCTGEILRIDHFGNLITSFAADRVTGRWELECAGRSFAIEAGVTFSDVGPGAPVIYAGSSGRVEIAVRDGSAAGLTQTRSGTPLRLVRLSP
jgi:hypothetical protein